MKTFQEITHNLLEYWMHYGCIIQQPYDVEVGAGTMHPETFFRVLGSQPYNVAYVQPSRRPTDGRYGENPNRVYRHYQLQVILKPSPDDVQDIYLESLRKLGIPLEQHDLRFEEDNWEAPTLGAWGIGWQVLLDGMEITQFTYFQQTGGLDLMPISAEFTYGLERIATFLADKESIFDLPWNQELTYGQVKQREEYEFSKYNFEIADTGMLFELFDLYEKESLHCLEEDCILPAYDYCLKCSHTFNLLDSRGAISVTQRVGIIGRVRSLALKIAKQYAQKQEEKEEQVSV